MAIEIERKFLVIRELWKNERVISGPFAIEQGYIDTVNETAVRIRTKGNSKAYLTIKGHRVNNACPEFEYEIPYDDAEKLLEMCEYTLFKDRYVLEDEHKQTWEVDVFRGKQSGLIIAEIEMQSVDQVVILPDWIGPEVSDDPNFTNLRLAKRALKG